jgi:hypothetical protein
MKLYSVATNRDAGKMGTKGMFIFSQLFFLQKKSCEITPEITG